ncbi:MAG TPA: class I SAM-dependent methyltransferase [Patescibacteria group bacterium]|nr:class I SAM-dependent methyltransferase [Patescibacteria group bacterium]
MNANKKIATALWKDNCKINLPCGIGSAVSVTTKIREFIGDQLKNYNIRSISDAGCGDFAWMNLVDLGTATYVGYDINKEMLDVNKTKYPKVSFIEFDLVNQPLPRTDLIICRDCLFHLPDASVIKALKLFKASGSPYLMTTSYRNVISNTPTSSEKFTSKRSLYTSEYGFREINLEKDPFNLSAPLTFIEESGFKRIFGLWRL